MSAGIVKHLMAPNASKILLGWVGRVYETKVGSTTKVIAIAMWQISVECCSS